jgi:hypothetical protein
MEGYAASRRRNTLETINVGLNFSVGLDLYRANSAMASVGHVARSPFTRLLPSSAAPTSGCLSSSRQASSCLAPRKP